MANRQIITRKKQPRKRQPRRRGTPVGEYFDDAWSLAKRTAAGLNQIRKMINTEEKYIDVSTTLSASRAGVVTYMAPIAQGDNISDRTGDSIKVQEVYLEGFITYNAAATTPMTARVIVFRELTNVGSAPTGGDLIQSASSQFATTALYNFVNGKSLNKRYSILFDEFFTLDLYNQIVPFSYHTTSGKHTFFRGTTAATGDAANGSYWFIVFTDVAANQPSFTAYSRLTFTDD